MESKVLRKDELSGLLYRLASNTKNINKYINEEITSIDDYEDLHSATLLKMHGDIERMIREKIVISLKYKCNNGFVNKRVVPITIVYEFGHTYLVAMDDNSEISFYEMRKIESFKRLKEQSSEEKRKATEYLFNQKEVLSDLHWTKEYVLRCRKDNIQDVKQKFKSAIIMKEEQDNVIINVLCNENEIIGWIMNQVDKEICLIEPVETIGIIKEKIKRLTNVYEMEEKNG